MSHHERVRDWLTTGAQPDCFGGSIIQRRLDSALAPAVGMTMAIKRGVRVDSAVGIDPDYPGPDGADHSMGAGQITGENPRGQTILCVVCDDDGLSHVSETRH